VFLLFYVICHHVTTTVSGIRHLLGTLQSVFGSQTVKRGGDAHENAPALYGTGAGYIGVAE
jgi:hypothetical protein